MKIERQKRNGEEGRSEKHAQVFTCVSCIRFAPCIVLNIMKNNTYKSLNWRNIFIFIGLTGWWEKIFSFCSS